MPRSTRSTGRRAFAAMTSAPARVGDITAKALGAARGGFSLPLRRQTDFAHHAEAVGAEMIAAVEHGKLELELGRSPPSGRNNQEVMCASDRGATPPCCSCAAMTRSSGMLILGLSVAGSDQT